LKQQGKSAADKRSRHRKSRVGRLGVTLDLPRHVAEEFRPALQRAADTCPVRLSLSQDLEIDVTYRWDR